MTTPLTASPAASVVFSVRRPIKTSTDDDCLGPHGVSSGFSRLLRQKTDRNQHRRRLSRSSRNLLRRLSSSPSEDRSKTSRTTTVSVLTASPPAFLVFSVRRPIETHHGRRLSRLSHAHPLPLQRSDALAKGIWLLFFFQSYSGF
ncbi:hypothetical protein YC2023_042770 [Brassica napus]